jgi:hypothetical protein
MADNNSKPAVAEPTAREEPVSPPQQHLEESSNTAQKSIEMETLSGAGKSTATVPPTTEISNGQGALSGGQTTTVSEQPEQSTSVAPAQGESAAGPSNTTETNDAPPLKAYEDKGASTSAPTVPEQEPLSINPAEPAGEETSPSDLVVDIMLIVTQSNSRHPFRISEKYLTKRSVPVPGVTEDGRTDPMSITVYTLKELILRDWRKEWEAPPREPVSIRLIYFGKMLEDKLPLSRTFKCVDACSPFTRPHVTNTHNRLQLQS